MNLLLILPEEWEEAERIPGTSRRIVTLKDRRAIHCAAVLRVDLGSSLRVGVLPGLLGTARVLSCLPSEVRIETDRLHPVPPSQLELVLALPRPKVLSRVLSACASFGLHRIFLTNAWKVEKSYFSSPRLGPEIRRRDLLLGLEQGGQVHLPEVSVHRSFREMLTEEFRAEDSLHTQKVVLHPSADASLADVLNPREDGRLVLAVGPEGGWIDRELESLRGSGFLLARLGTPPLRTEVAVAAALGQVALVRGSPNGPQEG